MCSWLKIIVLLKCFKQLRQFYREIIGYVDGIESPRLVGNKQQYKFFKFYLNNGNGRRVQVVAWNDDIDLIEHHILSNYVSISLSDMKQSISVKLFKIHKNNSQELYIINYYIYKYNIYMMLVYQLFNYLHSKFKIVK